MAWQEAHIDLTLDGGINANASEYAVNPPQLLKATNVIYDTPGVPRRAPTGESDAGNMTTGTDLASLHNVGDPSVFAAVARGGEAAAIGKNGLSRVLRDGAGSGSWQHIGDGSYTPAATLSFHLESERWTTSGNDSHKAASFLEHGGFKLMAYLPMDAGKTHSGLRLQVMGASGLTSPQDIEVAAVADVVMNTTDSIELIAGGPAGALIFWRRTSTTIGVVAITLSESGATAGAISTAITGIDATTPYAACADRDTSNDESYVVAADTASGGWMFYAFDGVVAGTTLATGTNLSAGFPPDIDHVTSGGTDLLAAALSNPATAKIDLVTTPTSLSGTTTKAGALNPGAGARCFVCGAGGNFFIACGGKSKMLAAILDAGSYFPIGETEEIRGYNAVARPAEVNGIPVWPLQWHNDLSPAGLPVADVIVSPQWNGGSAPGNLFLVPSGRCANDVNAASLGGASLSKVRLDVSASTPRASWAYTAELQGWRQTVRGVTLDAGAPESARFVQDSGITYASGSHLTAYDGRVHREADWLTPPLVHSIANGGAGTALGATGTWSARAVQVWIDATGRAHRSAPSNAVAGALNAADSLIVYCSVPYCTSAVSNLDGWPPDADTTAFFTEIYLKSPSDTLHRLATDTITTGTAMQPAALTVANYMNRGTFNDVVPNAAGSVIYDEVGAELWQNPSPPTADLEVIGNRMWLLDAEDRERLWPSKERVDGYAWEWNAGMVRRVPGGEVVALSQINGSPLALRRDGLFVIYGDGPGNNGSGGVFTPPRKIDGAPGCVTGNTVVKVPAGVVYQSDRGFFLLTPQLQATQIGLEVESLISDNFVAATYSERDGRVVFWRDTSGSDDCLVWDVRSNKWSTWDPAEATIAAVQLEGGDVATFATSGGNIVEARYGTSYTAGNGMVLETAWLKPQNINGRAEWADVFFTAEKLDDHSLTIALLHDYDNTTVSEPQTWTASELDEELSGSGTVYTVSKRIEASKARAIKIRITESAIGSSGEAVRPIAMRVIYRTDGKVSRAQAASTGRK